MVPVPDRSGDRADQLEGRAGAAAGGREPEGVGRQPHGGRGARPRRADVGARDRPPTGAGNGRLHRCRLAGVWQPTHPPTGTATGTVNKYEYLHWAVGQLRKRLQSLDMAPPFVKPMTVATALRRRLSVTINVD